MKTPYNWAKRDQIRSLLRMLDFEVTGKVETYKSHQDFPEDFEFGGVDYRLSDGCSSVRFSLLLGPDLGRLSINGTAPAQARALFEGLSLLRGIIETFSLCGGHQK